MMPSTRSSPLHGGANRAVLSNDGAISFQDILKRLSLDEASIAGKSAPSAAYSTETVAKQSPSSSPFVRRNADSPDHDPFASPVKVKKSSNNSSGPSKDKKLAMNGDWRSSHSASDDSTASVDSRTPSLVSADETAPVANVVAVVGSELAQSLYPPSCCVFVANLSQTESDESLEASVTNVFRDFGKVWVKVRRDEKNMPFSFCQYTNVENAQRAIAEGHGRIINGRPCRCEQAKAHRVFYVERKYGTDITTKEVTEIFGAFGDLVLCRYATPAERTTLNASHGVIIEYSMYDHGQNAFNAYKNHGLYKIQAIANMKQGTSTMPRRTSTYTSSQARALIENYDVDRRSIFVGSLFEGITKEDVHQLFAPFGKINEVNLREMRSKYNRAEIMTFAFVEYENPKSTDKAIEEMHAYQLNDNSGNVRSIRVAQKDSKIPAGRSVGTGSSDSPTSPPVYQTPQSMPPVTPTSSAAYDLPHTVWGTTATGIDWNGHPPQFHAGYNSQYVYGPGYPTAGFSPSADSPYSSAPVYTSPYSSPYGIAPYGLTAHIPLMVPSYLNHGAIGHNHSGTSPDARVPNGTVITPCGYRVQWRHVPGYGYVPEHIPAYDPLTFPDNHAHPTPASPSNAGDAQLDVVVQTPTGDESA